MTLKEQGSIDNIVKIAACVCGKDGVISEIEEMTIYKLIIEQYPKYTYSHFNLALDQFFDESNQIEEYLGQISTTGLAEFCIFLCEESASSDGLDIKENIALQRAKNILSCL